MPPLKSKTMNNRNAGPPQQWYSLTSAKNADNSLDKTYTNRFYPSKVLQNLNSLRHDNRFCDVEIVAGGKVMKVSVNEFSSSY